jgi:hypothetical protein
LLPLPPDYTSKDIPNSNDAAEEDFPIAHDDTYDGSVAADTLCVWADDESPTSLRPADNTVTKSDVANASILDAAPIVPHSESVNDGMSLSLFSVKDKVLAFGKFLKALMPQQKCLTIPRHY